MGLLLVLAALLALNIYEASLGDEVYSDMRQTNLREMIYVTALALDAEAKDSGGYPPDLETIGMNEEGLTYTRDSDGYTLIAEEEGTRVEFRSGDDMEPFRAAFEALLPPFPEG
ncbi:MAG: hypothetical protein ABIF09_10520 [Gemmatimonadota bacterium]